MRQYVDRHAAGLLMVAAAAATVVPLAASPARAEITPPPFTVAMIPGGAIGNAKLANPSLTLGSTTLTLGGTTTSLSGLTGINGVTSIGGNVLSSGGNTWFGPEGAGESLTTGTENTFFGGRTGRKITTGGGNSAFGLNALGDGGGCATVASNGNSAFGNDALRDWCGAGGAGWHTALGAWALKNLGVGNTNTGAGYITAVGGLSMWLLNNGNSGNASTAIGYSSCAGSGSDGSPAGSFRQATCLGAYTGGALTGANNFTLIGKGVGNTTFASGSGVILVGSGIQTVDTPAAGTSNYINIENAITVTGTNTSSTSQTSVAGTLRTGGYTVSGLPTGRSAGDRAHVTDATACTFGSTPTGGGSTFCPVIYTGSAWIEGALRPANENLIDQGLAT